MNSRRSILASVFSQASIVPAATISRDAPIYRPIIGNGRKSRNIMTMTVNND